MIKLIVLSSTFLAGAALAQTPGGDTESRRSGSAGDSNEVVCVMETEVGSRLGRRRVCRTRAEWAEHRGQYRDRVERAQQQMSNQYLDPPRPDPSPN